MNATMARLEEALVAGATRDFKMLLRFFVLWPTVRLCTLNVMFLRLETLVDTVRFFSFFFVVVGVYANVLK